MQTYFEFLDQSLYRMAGLWNLVGHIASKILFNVLNMLQHGDQLHKKVPISRYLADTHLIDK